MLTIHMQSSAIMIICRMTEKPSINWGADFTSANTLMIDENMKFQKILGYGGAFTEAAGLNFAKLSPADREKVRMTCRHELLHL